MIPDPIERGEAACEAWYFDNVGPDGRVKCCCGKWFKLEDGETLTADPYATPVCPDCFQEWFDEHFYVDSQGKMHVKRKDEDASTSADETS